MKQLFRLPLQPLSVSCRQHRNKRTCNGWGSRYGHVIRSNIFLNDDMGIGPSGTEAAHTSATNAETGRKVPGAALLHNIKWTSLQRDMRIQFAKVQRCRNLSMMDA